MPKSKSLCSGCYNNFYNNKLEEGCWSYKNAKVVRRLRVGTWQPPPYHWHPESCLTCYSPPGYSMLEKSDCRIKSGK